MSSISIELVPRSYEELSSQIASIHERFPQIDTLNIPDLLRFSIRSWDASTHSLPYFKTVIPHIRSIDFNLRGPFELSRVFSEAKLGHILVITGDKPQDMSHKVYRNTSLEMIRVLKKELPHLKVYAGIDPYRFSLTKELDYVHDKIEAGADGFFTQPFFDLRLLDIYMEHLADQNIYWGICPVTSDKSRSYWESKNAVLFPKSFKLEYQSNVELAKAIVAKSNECDSNVYFMPIRTDPIGFLADVLG